MKSLETGAEGLRFLEGSQTRKLASSTVFLCPLAKSSDKAHNFTANQLQTAMVESQPYRSASDFRP